MAKATTNKARTPKKKASPSSSPTKADTAVKDVDPDTERPSVAETAGAGTHATHQTSQAPPLAAPMR